MGGRGDSAAAAVTAGVPAASAADAALTPGLLAAIVTSSDDSIVSTDLRSIVTSWNGGAERLTGYTAATMIGRSMLEIIPPAYHDQERHVMARIAAGETIGHFETERRRHDGHVLHLSIAVSPIRDPAGAIVGVARIARDIALRRRHERETQRMSRLYAALSHINQAIVWSKTPEDLFARACRALVEQGGFRLAWVGRSDPATRRLVHVAGWGDKQDDIHQVEIYTDDRPEGRGPSGIVFRSGEPYICQDTLTDPAMSLWRDSIRRRGFNACATFPIRAGGTVWGTLSVYADEAGYFRDKEVDLLTETAADISYGLDNLDRERERRRAEAAAESERLFSESMIESMPGIVYFYDSVGRFLRWNRNFEVVSGYTATEIAAMHPLDFYRAGDRPALERRIAEVFESGEAFIEADFVAKSGTRIPHYFTGRRMILDGRPYLIGVGVDISERKRAEQALLELNDTLEHKIAARTEEVRTALIRAEAADRLKSAFLATMSHELRTPLNSIIGFTGIVLQELAGPLTAEQKKQLGMVRGSARHLLELINDVLDISKIEAGQLDVRAETFDLRATIERAVAAIRPLAEKKGLAVGLAIAPELGAMVGDRRRVEQILLNLLNNAAKFTDHGGIALAATLVSADAPDGDPAPDLSLPAVRVTVTDTGIGIRPADLPLLFQPFRQIDTGLARQHEGTGLGLAICRRLAALMGGTVTATSDFGKGSRFALTLPLRKAATP